MALSQPRQEESSSSSSGSEEESGDVDEELEQLDSPAARMYHRSMVFQQDQKRIREEVTKHKRSTFRIPVGHCAQLLTSRQQGDHGRALCAPLSIKSQGEGGCLEHSTMIYVKWCAGLPAVSVAGSQVWCCPWMLVVFDTVWFVPGANPLNLQTRCLSAVETAALSLVCAMHRLAHNFLSDFPAIDI